MSLLFAIPDHPWVDTAEGAAVRIAMTVGGVGEQPGELRTTTAEAPHDDGSSLVTFAVLSGRIAADLTTGADVAGTVSLKANEGLIHMGVKLHGMGFVVTPAEAASLGLGTVEGLEKHIRHYRNGRDLTDEPRGVLVIDLYGLTDGDVRQRFPAVYQRVLTMVKPERDQNKRASYRDNWWVFAEARPAMRAALRGLPRYIATTETAKHRIFSFLPAEILPDQKLRIVASDDAFHLGVLSSRIHVVWAGANGATLEDRPVYVNSSCFDPFPFPACDEAAKARIRALGEELDAHRKRVQAQHPGLSLTAMYNVLAKLRAAEHGRGGFQPPSEPQAQPEKGRDAAAGGSAAGSRRSQGLTAKEQATHDAGLVSVLRQLHDELDAAVAAAYGFPPDLSDAEILTRLVALNATRAAEEAEGQVRWLRPEYQSREQGAGSREQATQQQMKLPAGAGSQLRAPRSLPAKQPWPKPLAERVAAVERVLAAAAAPVTAEQLAKHFLRAKPEALAEILETLVTLGRAHREGEHFSV